MLQSNTRVTVCPIEKILGGRKMEDSKVTRSIRADAETIDRFKALAEQFSNQGECLESLIRTYEMDNAKSCEVEMKSEIRSFESHTNALYGLYISSIEKIGDLRKKNGSLSEQIKELTNKVAVYESVTNGESIENEDNDSDISRFKRIGELCATNRDLTAEVEKYKAENLELNNNLHKTKKENAELSAKVSELKSELIIQDKQKEFEIMKALNLKEQEHLKRVSELMNAKDKLVNELLELRSKL